MEEIKEEKDFEEKRKEKTKEFYEHFNGDEYKDVKIQSI